jgi:outer membrane protein W
MKQFIFLGVILALGTSVAVAQEFATDKKTILLTGSAAFSSSGGDIYSVNDKRISELNLSATFDYFIARNILIGMPVTLHRQYIGDYNIESTLGVGPELGYVYGTAKSRVLPYAKVGYQYSVMSSENWLTSYYYGLIGNGIQTDLIFSLGMILLLQKHVGLNPQISYHFQRYDTDSYYYGYYGYSLGSASQTGNILQFSIGLTGLLY